MSVRVTAPPGCYGIEMQDGKKYNANRDGLMRVADRHVDAIKRQYGPSGLLVTGEPHTIGTKTTRVCTACAPTRYWNAWNENCPRCGATTQLEEQQ